MALVLYVATSAAVAGTFAVLVGRPLALLFVPFVVVVLAEVFLPGLDD